jgi:hypothetical protein
MGEEGSAIRRRLKLFYRRRSVHASSGYEAGREEIH